MYPFYTEKKNFPEIISLKTLFSENIRTKTHFFCYNNSELNFLKKISDSPSFILEEMRRLIFKNKNDFINSF